MNSPESPEISTMTMDGSAAPKPRAGKAFLAACILVVLLAALLRVHHIAQRSLWLDEAIAANISRGTLPQTLLITRGLHSAPIVDPLILYGVERVSTTPLAVRTVSLVASLLAIVLMLCFVTIPTVDYRTALLAALMLTVSSLQIRYAQEVREYSLSVLYATLLVYVFLSYLNRKSESRAPIALYAAIFVAPLIQYGLVLFSCSVLAALLILEVAGSRRRRAIVEVFVASGCLILGSLLSYFLTLRYQFGDSAWYLDAYYWSRGSSLLRFAASNTHYLITGLLPGLTVAAISLIAIFVHLIASLRARAVPPLMVLALVSCCTVLVCAILRLYPYGGIRQCLFLAPILCLTASASLVYVVGWLKGRARVVAFAAVLGIVGLSGALQIHSLKPYAEVENIQPVLSFVEAHRQPVDSVFIYPGAVPAVDFYIKQRDPHFLYSDFHQDNPSEYVQEADGDVGGKATRLWIVFSHVYKDEDQIILRDLRHDWNVEPELSVKGAALYLATRVPKSTEIALRSAAPPVTDDLHDSFIDWNIRNSRASIR